MKIIRDALFAIMAVCASLDGMAYNLAKGFEITKFESGITNKVGSIRQEHAFQLVREKHSTKIVRLENCYVNTVGGKKIPVGTTGSPKTTILVPDDFTNELYRLCVYADEFGDYSSVFKKAGTEYRDFIRAHKVVVKIASFKYGCLDGDCVAEVTALVYSNKDPQDTELMRPNAAVMIMAMDYYSNLKESDREEAYAINRKHLECAMENVHGNPVILRRCNGNFSKEDIINA